MTIVLTMRKTITFIFLAIFIYFGAIKIIEDVMIYSVDKRISLYSETGSDAAKQAIVVSDKIKHQSSVDNAILYLVGELSGKDEKQYLINYKLSTYYSELKDADKAELYLLKMKDIYSNAQFPKYWQCRVLSSKYIDRGDYCSIDKIYDYSYIGFAESSLYVASDEDRSL